MLKIGHILMFNEELAREIVHSNILTKYQMHEHAQDMHMAHIRNTFYVILYLFYIP